MTVSAIARLAMTPTTSRALGRLTSWKTMAAPANFVLERHSDFGEDELALHDVWMPDRFDHRTSPSIAAASRSACLTPGAQAMIGAPLVRPWPARKSLA